MPEEPNDLQRALDSEAVLTESLERLAGTLLSEETLDTIMELVAQLARASLSKADAVGVTLLRDGEIYTANYSDETARRIDGIQYDNGEGPCLTSLVEQRVVHLGSIAEETRWPAFVRAALEAGISSILSMPLQAKSKVSGAINFYSREPGFFDEAQRRSAERFARQASVLLANASDYTDAARLNKNLQEALKTRDVIGQAKGILMMSRNCDPDAAFEILKSISQETNIKLRDVAEGIVDEVIRFRAPETVED